MVKLGKVDGVISEMLDVSNNILIRADEYPGLKKVPELRIRTMQIIDEINQMKISLIKRPNQGGHISDEIAEQFGEILKNLKAANSQNNPNYISNTILQIEKLMSGGLDRFFISGAVPKLLKCQHGHFFVPPPPARCPIDDTAIS